MTISTSKAPSSITTLKDALREAFPDYSFKLFGFKDKSILVSKSPLVGVQISNRENDIMVMGSPPTVLAGLLVYFLSVAGFSYFTTEFIKLEKDIACYLYQ